MKGATLDPLAPAQSKHRFSPPTWALKLLWFPYNFMLFPGTFGIKLGAKDSKTKLESNILESLRFFCAGSIFGSLLPTLWTASSCLWDVMPSKSQGFLKTKGWTPKDWCPTMSGGHCRFKVSAFSRTGETQGHPKTTI